MRGALDDARDMDDGVDSLDQSMQRRRVVEIAEHDFERLIRRERRDRHAAREDPHLMARRGQSADDMRSDKTGRPGDGDPLHRR